MSGRVLVVGSVNIDLVVTADRLPAPGETVIGGRFAQHHGGKGGNQAVAAARMRASTAFIGAVGDDEFGRTARAALESEGVDVSELRTVPDVPTGVALILVDARGENSIAVAAGANGAVSPRAVEESLRRLEPGAGDVVLVGHEIPTISSAAALRAGRTARATTILNPAPATGLDAETVGLADLVTPNEGELAMLRVAGIEPERMLVSRGPDGAQIRTGDGEVNVPALVVQAVDTVGAGDTLNGALAAGVALGRSLDDAARRAVAAASLAVTRPGAREGMPTADEVDAALRA